MIDPHISPSAARAHLHRPDATDPLAMGRRRFLQLVGMGLGAGLVAGPGTSLLDHLIPGMDPTAWALGPVGANDGILVVVTLFGGNDGMNTVVPLQDDDYFVQRGKGQFKGLVIPREETLAINADYGFHPEIPEFKRLWDAGQLAIVDGVGHTDPNDFSHFSSMAKWMSGDPRNGPKSTGWIGRWLDYYLPGQADLFAAAEIGYTLPLHSQGAKRIGTTVPPLKPDFGVVTDPKVDGKIYDTIRRLASDDGSWLSEVGQAQVDQLRLAQTTAPIIPAEADLTQSKSEIVERMEVAANLINANLGLRVLSAGFMQFDSHANQVLSHPLLLKDLNTALQRFYAILDPAWAGQVTIMTVSEFGRTSWGNAGLGTDHGSSAPQFVMGAKVKGGFYGERAPLKGLGRWDRPATPVDFRNYYGSLLDGWLGGGGTEVLGAGFTQDLGLFASGPQGTGFFPADAKAGQFVGIAPTRIYDSRDGTGGRTAVIGPNETVKIQMNGVGGVPGAGVRAVAINISSINPTETTFLTAYPTGFPRPNTASLNPRLGAVVPNMAVVGVGQDGTVSVFNSAGNVHITVDLMGYFQEAAASKLTPLTPARILDTRDGVGAPKVRVGSGSPLVLAIAGQGGIPSAGVDSVVLNLTSVGPSENGWITAWPTGSERPTVANLSYRKGETIPNMIVCKVGADGKINIQPSVGDLELVGDVVACYTTDGVGFQPTAPARLLDTRSGTGAPLSKLGAGQEIELQVGGQGGVPAGASAAIINITGIRPSESTFLTVYPDGEPRPTAASLNPASGKVNGNLISAKLGAGGKIRIFNERGALDVTADVTGYFS